MLMMLNKSPTHIIGAAEGFIQKFAYYNFDEQDSKERLSGFLTSARNLFRCIRTVNQGNVSQDKTRQKFKLKHKTYQKPNRKH